MKEWKNVSRLYTPSTHYGMGTSGLIISLWGYVLFKFLPELLISRTLLVEINSAISTEDKGLKKNEFYTQ